MEELRALLLAAEQNISKVSFIITVHWWGYTLHWRPINSWSHTHTHTHTHTHYKHKHKHKHKHEHTHKGLVTSSHFKHSLPKFDYEGTVLNCYTNFAVYTEKSEHKHLKIYLHVH